MVLKVVLFRYMTPFSRVFFLNTANCCAPAERDNNLTLK